LKELEIKGEQSKAITILVTNPDYHWFKKSHDFYSLLKEAVETIKLFFPDKIIFVKAKPSLYNVFINHEIFKNNDKVYFYKKSLASLTESSLFCLSIHESSGIFDFLTTDVPVIEYSDYNNEYLKVFPAINPWKGTPGFFIADDVNRLKLLIKKIYDEEIIYSNKELSKYYKQKQDLKLFGDN